jgi:hypothetical protein
VDRYRTTAEFHCAGPGRSDSENDARKFCSACADQSGKADDLSGTDFERHTVYAALGAANVHETQCNFPGSNICRWIEVGHFSPDHLRDQLCLVQVVNPVRTHAFTVAEYSHAIGQCEDFLQPMRDVDDADSVLSQFAHQREKQMLLFERQGSSWLVHDDDTRSASNRTRDLHELLLWHRERSNFPFRGNVRTDLAKESQSPFPLRCGGNK